MSRCLGNCRLIQCAEIGHSSFGAARSAAGVWDRANRGCRREAGWESGKPAFGFPLFQTASPSCGNVEISPLFGEISKELVERVGSLLLAFHAFHSPVISTAPPSPQVPGAALSKCSHSSQSNSLSAR